MSNLKRIQLKLKDIFRHFRPKHNVIFIHINKTGGSSIEESLGLPREHKTAGEKLKTVGQQRWQNTPSFCVVRNPWDKVVSHYHYRVQTNQTGMGDKHINFKDWVYQVYHCKNEKYLDKPRMFMPQIEWVWDGNEILVDKVIRFENLGEGFSSYMKELGIDAELPHIKSSSREKYNRYYDNRSRDIVGDWFQEDIRAFDYSFEEMV